MSDFAQLEAQFILDVGSFDRDIKAVQSAIKDVVNQFEFMSREQDKAQESTKQTAQESKQLQEALDKLDAAQKEAANSAQDLGGSLSESKQHMGELTNSTKQAQQDFKAANSESYDLGVAIGTTLKGAVLAGAAAFLSFKTAQAAISAVTTEAQRAADVFNKGLQLNVNTDNLQAMYFAAEKVGLSAENINDILKDINDKMGDVSLLDGGEMKDLFKALNLDVKEFIGMSPDKVLLAINQAAAKLSSQERANIFESMGNDLDFLKPLLVENGRLLDENMQKAKQFGLVSTGLELTAWHEFNNTLADISGRFEGMRRQVMAGLAEPLAEAVKFVDQWIESMGGAEELANDIANGIVTGLQMAVEAAAWLGKAFFAIKPILDLLANATALIARGIIEIVDISAKLPESISPIAALDKLTNGAITNATSSSKQILDNYLQDAKTIEKSVADSAKKIEEIDAFKNGFNNALEKGRQSANASYEAKINAPELEKELASLKETLDNAQKQVTEQQNNPNGSTETLAKAIVELAKAQAAYDEKKAQLESANASKSGLCGQNDGELSKARYQATQDAKAEEERAKALDRQQKELLKQQQEQLQWKNKLDLDIAKQSDDAAKLQRESSDRMSQATQSFSDSVRESKDKGGKSSLSLDGAKMSFFTGGGGSDSNVPSPPKYAGQASPASQQNMGEITITVASKDSIIKQFPVLAAVKDIGDLKNAIDSGIYNYAQTGGAANS